MRKQVGRGEQIPEPGALLETMGTCRRALIRAGDGVKPFGASYHALQMVVRAIDTLAYYVTGQRDYYSIGGSTGVSAGNGITGDRS